MRKCSCPNCNAPLEFDEKKARDFIFCQYCGTKVDLVDLRINQNITNRIVDEAAIELEKTKQKRLETELKIKESNNEKVALFIGLLLVIVMMIFAVYANSTF